MSKKIDKKEFAARRKRLMADMAENSIAIIPSAGEITRNNDVQFRFRQDSDFYYLTGFDEPNAVAVIAPGRGHGEFVLFCQDKDPERELWDGYRAGPDGAIAAFQADDAFPTSDIDDILPGLIEGKSCVYYSLGRNKNFDASVMGWVNSIRANARQGAQPPGEFIDLDHLLHDLRLFKSAAEIKVMQEAGRITANAHKRAMKAAKAGVYEYQLEAEIMHEFAINGARLAAYPSIVGGGENACVLHYIENQDKLKNGDLVLIDAGCELDYYASDITRTFPVSGKFTEPQKTLYNIVLAAQLAAFEKISSNHHWNEAHEATVEVITQGLIDVGILSGSLQENIESGSYRKYYMHRAGHWLGLDVHDVGDYKVGGQWRQLEPGMVMTVEPGIYIRGNDENVPKAFRGIGIRIEDDVVVTKDGYQILTDGVPKTVEAIEQLMAG